MAKAYSLYANFQKQRAEHAETFILHWQAWATNAETLSHRIECEKSSLETKCANARAKTGVLRQKLKTFSQTVQEAVIEAQKDVYLPVSVPAVHMPETEEVETLIVGWDGRPILTI